ncbi:ABC transporter substrate-binding protein/permease [Aeromicrobium sp. Root495]|uniref:ABC transporter substrate-binding protein/permease n=1 Tax=Aeromicrobium sp. Root495 TaxID=1736550 RepID=UPI0009EB859A|nr:ABC transporter substrate-binding protein/permease [Aeromicrobium sp. Root495]
MRRLLVRSLAAVVVALAVTAGLGAASPASAADEPVVVVGTEGTYPPFTFHDPDTDDLTGYDIEVVKAVAKEAGWRLTFVESSFDSLFVALDSQRIDVIANQISINPEREAKYGLSTPYTYSRGVIVTPSDVDDITTLKDIKGLRAAQSTTSNWAGVAKEAGAKIEAVDGLSQAAKVLEQGRADVIVNDNIAILDYLATSGTKKIKIAGEAEGQQTQQALMFRKADSQLKEQADAALQTLRDDGTLKRISEDYFKADVSIEDGGEAQAEGRAGRSALDVVKDQAWPVLKALVKVTIPLTAISFVVGLALALGVALARISPRRLLSVPAGVFISIVRGTPLLLQLAIVFYGLPEIGLNFDRYVAAVLAFSINIAGYAAEIIRSAILAVPKGQTEAARTIGLDYRQTLRRVVLPQALRTAVPPLSNSLLSLVKDTSLASTILVVEAFRVTLNAANESTEYLALLILLGFYYWVVCWILSIGQRRLETRLDRYV